MSITPLPGSASSTLSRTDAMNCLYLNARSIKSVTSEKNKPVELRHLLSSHEINLVAVTETWLTDDVADLEIMPPHLTCYRKDRAETRLAVRGGGVMLGIDNRVQSKRRKDLECDAEVLICELTGIRRLKIAIILAYRPPNCDQSTFNALLDETLTKVATEFGTICLLGDFNLPSIDWNALHNATRTADSDFIRLTQSHAFEQLNHEPSNAQGSFLDLLFSNDSTLLGGISHLDDEFNFDVHHRILLFNMHLHNPLSCLKTRRVFNYKGADLALICGHFNDVLVDQVTVNINESWSFFSEQVKDTVSLFVPVNIFKESRDPVWFDSEARQLVKKKRTMYRKAKRVNTDHLWRVYKDFSNNVRTILRTKHSDFINSLGDVCSQNPKRFWSFFRRQTKNPCLPMNVNNGVIVSQSPYEKAKLFNDYFSSVFTNPDLTLPVCNNVFNNPIPIPEFHVDDVTHVLKDLDVNKAYPPSGISPFILKNCRNVLAQQLTFIFNQSISTGTVPTEWKTANVVPIFKKGDRSDVCNYRPVSLLSPVSKVMERCLFNHLYPFIEPLLHDMQHGFMKHRSCTTQLLKCYHSIGQTLDEGGQVDVIYLDFSKAFDSVPHSFLILKLKMYFGVSGVLLSWFKSYLSERHQRVVVEGEESDWSNVTSGVPQGSILGPLLFLLFINDMPNVVLSSSIALFADDSKVFKSVNCIRDCELLQSDLCELLTWSKKWGMVFNPSKCKVLSFTRSRNPFYFNYHLDGIILDRVGDFKDLGVVFNQNLSFSAHVESIVSKSNRVCGMIKRSIGYRAPQNVKLKLFKSLARPVLEYSSQVWSPVFKNDIHAIESVQRSMTKYICNDFIELSYSSRLKELHILPLSYRREVADLIFIFKYLKGAMNVDFNDEVRVLTNNRSLRSSSEGLLLRSLHVRTECFISSYFNRICHLWNILPIHVRNSTSISIFKSQLYEFYIYKSENTFDIFSSCTWTSTCRCSGTYHVF